MSLLPPHQAKLPLMIHLWLSHHATVWVPDWWERGHAAPILSSSHSGHKARLAGAAPMGAQGLLLAFSTAGHFWGRWLGSREWWREGRAKQPSLLPPDRALTWKAREQMGLDGERQAYTWPGLPHHLEAKGCFVHCSRWPLLLWGMRDNESFKCTALFPLQGGEDDSLGRVNARLLSHIHDRSHCAGWWEDCYEAWKPCHREKQE